MKKAINILFRISRILSLVVIVLFATLATIYFFVALFNQGNGTSDAVKYFVISLFAVVAAYLSFTRQQSLEELDSKVISNSVWCIVMGIIGSVPTLAAAGIVALIYNYKNNHPSDKAEVVDEKKED